MWHPVIARAKYYDSVDNVTRERSCLLYASNLTNAMGQLEEYFGDELEGAYVEIFEEGLIEVPSSKYDEIYHWLNEGVNDETDSI